MTTVDMFKLVDFGKRAVGLRLKGTLVFIVFRTRETKE